MIPDIQPLRKFNDADELSRRLLALAEEHQLCILDSGGSGYQKSRFLIAGIPERSVSVAQDTSATLAALTEMDSDAAGFDFFTLSYDFGRRLEISDAPRFSTTHEEPDFFRSHCRAVVIHDYDSRESWLAGDSSAAESLANLISRARPRRIGDFPPRAEVTSNFSREEYVELVREIQELIRNGVTYQTNLTQQLTARATETPATVFGRLRTSHPAAFSAYLDRVSSQVVSASPELFLSVTGKLGEREIRSSPIKGTRPRGGDHESDESLRTELLTSEKDRAENIMIVDLIRNDLGRVCKFGTVSTDKLCEIEMYPTLFHLVSTVRGRLRANVRLAEIVRAAFPCGSITGAPKISTMRIIDRLETVNRGLSMGAIGYAGPSVADLIAQTGKPTRETHMSVAIRTMTCRDGVWRFNVGGGIVIDSDPDSEYEETVTKARALLGAIGGEFSGNKSV